MNNIRIGSYLKSLRVSKGISQSEMADRLFITRQAISNWERGKAVPDVGMMEKLADFFEVRRSS